MTIYFEGKNKDNINIDSFEKLIYYTQSEEQWAEIYCFYYESKEKFIDDVIELGNVRVYSKTNSAFIKNISKLDLMDIYTLDEFFNDHII